MREQGSWRHIFGDATIVLLTSHHAILKVGSTIVTLPSNDIAQIVAPKPYMVANTTRAILNGAL
jgi:hypothetical protein